MFANIGELANETNDDTEKILWQFMEEKMKIAKECAKSIDFDNGGRAIVAKFNRFKDRMFESRPKP